MRLARPLLLPRWNMLLTVTLTFWALTLLTSWVFHRDALLSAIPHRLLPAQQLSGWVPTTAENYGFAHEHDISRGYWAQNREHRNDTIHWGHGLALHDCKTPSKLVDGALRVEDVDGWEWVMQDGRKLAEWDYEEFTVRALQSRVGFIMVGDSLTEHIFTCLQTMLCLPNPRIHPRAFDRFFEYGPVLWRGHKNGKEVYHSNLTLHNDHPLKKKLLERWENKDPALENIPRSRFDEPIVRFWKNTNLGTQDELEEVIDRGMNSPIDHAGDLRILALWKEDLARYEKIESWSGEKPAIAMINSGAHWSPTRFKAITSEQMKEAYGQVMKLVYDLLPSVLSTLPIRIHYRSTLAGHENCYNNLYPVTIYDDAAQNPTGNRNKTYQWHWFPDFNEVAKEIWGQGRLSLGKEYDDDLDVGRSNIVTEYWDVWDLSVTRPDAHVGHTPGNGMDCLHWCPAGIYEWIIRAWWHTIVTENV